MTQAPIHQGDIWTMTAAATERLALVISSDIFNLDSGLDHVLTMLVASEPGPYSFPFREGDAQLHVWPAHIDSTPKHLLRSRIGTTRLEVFSNVFSNAHRHLFMILHEPTATPQPR